MVASTEYLESAKVEQVELEMRSRGYATERQSATGDTGYDLVATRGSERIAIEVKAQSRLGTDAAQIGRLREHALREGYTEFRLVVVNPPRRSRIEVEGLEEALEAYLMENHPAEIDELSSNTVVLGVSDAEVDEIEVGEDGTHVLGDAALELELQYGSDSDGAEMNLSLPLHFDVILGPNHLIAEVKALKADTSSFYG